MDWTRFETPVPIGSYDLIPGAQIEVEYTDGLASDPRRVRETYLIGEVNDKGACATTALSSTKPTVSC